MDTAESWLRVVTYKLPEDQDKGLQFVKDSLGDFIRVLSEQPGYGGGYWGDSDTEGTLTAVTHWGSLQAIEDASVVLKELQSRGGDLGFSVLDVQNLQLFDVPANAMPVAPGSDEADATAPRWKRFRRSSEGTAEMADENWLRVVLYRADRPDDPQSAEYMSSSTASALALLQDQPGFQRGFWGHNPAAGTMAAVTYWGSRWAIDAASPVLVHLQSERERRGIRTMR